MGITFLPVNVRKLNWRTFRLLWRWATIWWSWKAYLNFYWAWRRKFVQDSFNARERIDTWKVKARRDSFTQKSRIKEEHSCCEQSRAWWKDFRSWEKSRFAEKAQKGSLCCSLRRFKGKNRKRVLAWKDRWKGQINLQRTSGH